MLGAAAIALMTPIAHAYLLTGSPYYPYSWLVRIALRVRRRGAGLPGGAPGPARRPALRHRSSAAALPVLIAVGLVLGERLGPGRGGAVIALFPLLVGALALADRGPAMVLARPWAVHGGRVSYALYLVHIPMFEVYWTALQHVRALGPHTLLAHLTGLGVLVATLGVAAVAYRCVEEPARRRLLRGAQARPAPAARRDARAAARRRRTAPRGTPSSSRVTDRPAHRAA